MDKDLIKTYSFRISQASRTDLIVIMYDMAIDYLGDARSFLNKSDMKEFHDSIKKAKISTGMYTIYHQGGIMAGYSTDVRSIAAIRFIAILFPSPYCSRITGGCQLSSAVISGT